MSWHEIVKRSNQADIDPTSPIGVRPPGGRVRGVAERVALPVPSYEDPMAGPPLDVDPPLSLEPVVGWRVGASIASAVLSRSDPSLGRPSASEGRHGGDVCPTSRVDRSRRALTCGLYAAASPDTWRGRV